MYNEKQIIEEKKKKKTNFHSILSILKMLKELVASSENLRKEHCCGGCGSPIRDRYYLLVADRAWHGQCLRCCKCSQPLDAALSCFAREGNIYCKEDYYRLFSSRKCARCGAGISSSELVMRAKELVFHVDCFSCALCGIHLSTGDTAALRSGRVLCGEHYDVDILSESDSVSTATQFYGGNSSKGRPRRRKPLTAHHSDESSADMLDIGSTSMRLELFHNELPQSLDISVYDGSQSPGSGGSISGQTRTKRMRTSFKHHQLRTMKSYFAINQNPDAKDLKQLAQKTGLPKRVLQVWFQNARAKWRRNVMRQEGGNTGGSVGVGGVISSNIGNNHNQISSAINLSSGGPPSVQSNTGSNIESISHTLEEIHHMTFAELF